LWCVLANKPIFVRYWPISCLAVCSGQFGITTVPPYSRTLP
jgi:hypothetical protein